MNSPKSPTAILPPSGGRFATHVWRNLNFRIDPDMILDGPDISQIASLDHFVRLALETTATPFFVNETASWGRGEERDWHGQIRAVRQLIRVRYAVANRSVQMARELAAFLPTLLWRTTIFDSVYQSTNRLRYAPHIRMLFDVFLGHPIAGYYRDARIDMDIDRVDPDVAETYNDFVDCFRRTVLTDKLLRRELHNWGWGSRENVTKLDAYLDGLFARNENGSVTVLHLRLSHRRTGASSAVLTLEQQRRDLQLLRRARTLFFDRMRRKPALFTDAPGYVWAIMPLANGSYELHLTLLFDSAALRKVVDDKRVEAEQAGTACEDHADLVGAYWIKTGAGGQGSYRRGDRYSGLYDPAVWVHGEVRADDGPRRAALGEALGYLARRRSLVRLESELPGEYFGLPERKPRRSRRPRGADARGAIDPRGDVGQGTKSVSKTPTH